MNTSSGDSAVRFINDDDGRLSVGKINSKLDMTTKFEGGRDLKRTKQVNVLGVIPLLRQSTPFRRRMAQVIETLEG